MAATAEAAAGAWPRLTNPVWIYGDDDDTLFGFIALGTGEFSPGDAFGKLRLPAKGSEAVVGPMWPLARSSGPMTTFRNYRLDEVGVLRAASRLLRGARGAHGLGAKLNRPEIGEVPGVALKPRRIFSFPCSGALFVSASDLSRPVNHSRATH